ncbi:MAG: ActS/PrrB/RegB family redox-sensitive histidine kinase, partial [Alphaproteobacteria bacterium]|nr:ActS/PrrB/RegB family redox-sensitive histidine kinase [Alphaproteobacteria bacterium]
MSESGGTTEAAGGTGGLRLLPGAGRVGRLRLRTLVTIRWIALVGQALALLFVHFGLGFQVPLTPALLIVACYLAFNLAIFLIYPSAHRLDDRSAASQLALDVLQLALLLFLTGGLKNPFALLLLVPVTISATILSLVSTVGLALLVLALVTLLAFLHLPLPWGEPGIMLPDLYVAGTWTALVLGMGFVAIYAWQVAAEARRMADALAATQLVLAREQQLSALGGLAAAAAHELGTPLGTIVLVAKELLRELPPGSPFVEDVRLLSSQAERCREILAQLSQRRPVEDQAAIARLPIGALVEE